MEKHRKVLEVNLDTLVCVQEKLRGVEKGGKGAGRKAGPVSSE